MTTHPHPLEAGLPPETPQVLGREAAPDRVIVSLAEEQTMELHVPLLPVPAGFGNILARSLGYHATIPVAQGGPMEGEVKVPPFA